MRRLWPRTTQALFGGWRILCQKGDAARAIPYLSAILRLATNSADDVIVGNVFSFYDGLNVLKPTTLDPAIPNARSASAWMQHLMSTVEPSDVLDTWHWMRAKGFADDGNIRSLVNYLFQKQRFSDAGEEWGAYFSARHDGFPERTRVFNGGFEYPPTNGEFDWNDDQVKQVRIARDDMEHHDGRYSMRFEFLGNDNPDFHHFWQAVYLTPGRYRLEGFLKTAAITGAEGLRLRVGGFQNANILAETDALGGTNDWTPLGVTFDVQASTPIVEIMLARRRALRIDNQLTGRAWLDSVTLTPVH